MKKSFIILSLLLLSLCLYAETGNIRFRIVWHHDIDVSTILRILTFEGDENLPDNTKALSETEGRQDVAMLRYSTNSGGLHTLSYTATSLQTENGESSVGYKLYLTYEGVTTLLEVGSDTGTTYPSELGSVRTSFNVNYGITSPFVAEILVRAELTELEDMRSNVLYSSTVTVERISN